MIRWDITKEDAKVISRIVERARVLGVEQPQIGMDIHACHANGCPLDLNALADADEFDFVHDIAGIHRHLDRTTGQLTGSFLPRHAAHVAA